jgi:hypothetical protein
MTAMNVAAKEEPTMSINTNLQPAIQPESPNFERSVVFEIMCKTRA